MKRLSSKALGEIIDSVAVLYRVNLRHVSEKRVRVSKIYEHSEYSLLVLMIFSVCFFFRILEFCSLSNLIFCNLTSRFKFN